MHDRTRAAATLLAGLFGASGIAMGAFGAHFLKSRLEPEMLGVLETAVRYHLLHAVVLLGVASAPDFVFGPKARALLAAGFSAGIVLFSGSLYALALSGTGALGAVTPFGGLCFIASWLGLAVLGLRSLNQKH